ncbi:MAG: O-antigen ligase family protein [Planctomycetes bacterium]|nr:O-antigen ligase family protein [Planctomycetota bacterium]
MAGLSSRDGLSGPLKAGAVLAAILCAGYVLGIRVGASTDRTSRVFLVLASAGVFVLPIVLKSWRATFLCGLVYIASSGLLNHLTNYHTVTRTLKFAVLGAIVCHWFLSEGLDRVRSEGWRRYPLLVPLGAFAALSALEMFNPAWTTTMSGVKAGLSGLTMHVLPMVLVFVGYDFVTDKRQLSTVLIFVVAVSSLIAAFGLFQYWIGLDKVAGWGESFSATLRREHTWGKSSVPVMKPISMASDAGEASMYYVLGFVLAAILYFRPGGGAARNLWFPAIMILLLVALFLTQLRFGMVAIAGTILFFFLFGNRGKCLFIVVLVAVAFFLAFFLSAPAGREVLVERYSVLQDPVDAAATNRGVQFEMIQIMCNHHPFGAGIGRAGPGAYVGASEEDRATAEAPGENYYASLVYETGIPGLLLMLGVFFLILRRAWVLYYRVPTDPENRTYCLGAAAFLLALMGSGMAGPVLYSTPASILFWFVAGVLFRLPARDPQEEPLPVAGRYGEKSDARQASVQLT